MPFVTRKTPPIRGKAIGRVLVTRLVRDVPISVIWVVNAVVIASIDFSFPGYTLLNIFIIPEMQSPSKRQMKPRVKPTGINEIISFTISPNGRTSAAEDKASAICTTFSKVLSPFNVLYNYCR